MKRRLRVLYVLPATAIGGAETRFFAILGGMPDVEATLLTHRIVADYYQPLGLDMPLFEDFGCHEPMPMSPGNLFRYSEAIAHIVRNRPFDLVFGVMHVGTLYAAFANDRFRLRIPLIGSVLGHVSGYFRAFERAPSLWERLVIHYLVRRPRALVVSSKGVKDDLILHYGASPSKVVVIPNGIDLKRVQVLGEVSRGDLRSSGLPLIVTACRLNAQKDLVTLLNAFERVLREKPCRLAIVGGGELRQPLMAYSESLGLTGAVDFLGYQENPFQYMAQADVFVLSSLFEGFGNVIIEAMALGIPVIATDCPSGPAAIIQHDLNGYLVPMQDADGLAKQIQRVLEYPAERAEIVIEARRSVGQYDLVMMLERYRALYEGVLNA